VDSNSIVKLVALYNGTVSCSIASGCWTQ